MVARVLFVCLANTCRSPMAEGVFRRMAAEAGLKVKADSAGIGGRHMGDPPDRRARAAALIRGVNISGLRARQVIAEDYRDFDLMLAMDRPNLVTLRSRTPPDARAEIALLLDYAPGARADEVRDPYFDDSFTDALDLIEAGCAGLVDALRKRA